MTEKIPEQLILVGASHKTTPLSILESIALTPDEVCRRLPEIRERAALGEAMLLSTCNRTEVYGTAVDPAAAAVKLEEWLLEIAEREGRLRPDHIVHRWEREVVDHLFHVTCGVDSMMLGETQIMGQIETSLEIAMKAETAGAGLIRLVSAASRVCKRARSETAISAGVVSVASATTYLARRIFGDLSRRTVMIVGTGETGTLAAKHFRNRPLRRLIVTNRTGSRAEELAREVDGEAVPFEERDRYLGESDVAICATHSKELLFTKEGIGNALAGRASRMLLLIDISLPRNIDPAADGVENVFLHDMNDLKQIVDQNLERRSGEIPLVRQIVQKEVDAFFRGRASLGAGPLIRDLRGKFEAIREKELDRSLRKFREEDHEAVRRLTRDLIQKLIHHPVVEMRESAKTPEIFGERISWFRRLFGLDESDEENDK